MKIGLGLMAPIAPDAVLSIARYAEPRGIEHFFFNDHMEPWAQDVFVNLTLLATNTDHATIGPGVVNPYSRHPVVVARAIAHLDQIAPGRVFLNWGVGHPHALTSSLGIPRAKPLARMRETIELSKLILSGHIPPEVQLPVPPEYNLNYRGEFFQFTDNFVLPSRKAPVGISTNAPKMSQLGGELADFVYIGHHTDPEGNEWCLDNIAAGAARAGRTLDDLSIHRGVHICCWPDSEVALDTIASIGVFFSVIYVPYRKQFGIKLAFEEEIGDAMKPSSSFYKKWAGKSTLQFMQELKTAVPRETQLRFCIGGTPDQCIEQLRRMHHERFDVLHLIPVAPPPRAENMEKTIKLLVDEVVPAIQEYSR